MKRHNIRNPFAKLVTSLLQAVHKSAASLQKLAHDKQAFYKPAASCFLQENLRLYCSDSRKRRTLPRVD